MSSTEPQQVFVRNDKGKLWGPITLQTLEILLDNGLIEGRIQLSLDGINFAFPGRFPELRDAVPPELWGEGAPPPGAPKPAVAPPAPAIALGPAPGATPSTPVPGAGSGAPMAGPGAIAHAAAKAASAGGAPMAGPGTRTAQTLRPGPGAVPGGPPGRPASAPPGAAAQAARAQPAPAGTPTGPRPPIAPPAPGAPAAASAPPNAPAPAPTSVSSAVPPPPAPEKLAPPASGDLSKHSMVRLYFLAAASDQNGLLTVQLADRAIEVHFRKGNPEYVSSNHPDDAVGAFFLKEKLVTPEQLIQAEGAAPNFGGDLVTALFGSGILNPATAFTHLGQRAQQILLKAVLATQGTFTFAQQELPAHKAMSLGNRWAVLMELVRKVPPPEVRKRLGDVADNPVMKSGGAVAVGDLRLSPQETRALGFIDGVRSLNLLARDMPQDADVFFRLAFALRDMDIVSFAAVKLPNAPTPQAAAAGAPAAAPAAAAAPSAPKPPGAPASPAPAAGPGAKPAAPAAGPGAKPAAPAAGPGAKPAAPAAPTASPGARPAAAPVAGPGAKPAAAPAAPAPSSDAAPAPANVEAELKSLRELASKLKEQTKFQLLGLTDKADGGAVKLAYFKLAKNFHPDTVPQNAPPELGKLKADIFAAIGDAYRTLSDDASRAKYVQELKEGAQEVDVAKILHAEELFQKGCILVKAKKFPEAVEMLSEAITANPDEGEFYAWRGIARFYVNPDKKAGKTEADRDINTALKKNPRCAPAHFFTGQMWKLLGDSKQALASFNKTLELQPDHLDAQREIRYLKK